MHTAISPNNLYVASAAEYGIVQISHFETMESVCRIKLGVGRAVHVSFFADNQHVLVRAHDSWYMYEDVLRIYNAFDGSFVSQCIFDADDPVISRDGQSIFFSFGFGRQAKCWIFYLMEEFSKKMNTLSVHYQATIKDLLLTSTRR